MRRGGGLGAKGGGAEGGKECARCYWGRAGVKCRGRKGRQDEEGVKFKMVRRKQVAGKEEGREGLGRGSLVDSKVGCLWWEEDWKREEAGGGREGRGLREGGREVYGEVK